MATQTWTNLLNAGSPWQTSNGPTITSTTGTSTISPQAPGNQDFVMPGQPNGLQWYPGMTLRVRARGTVQAGATTANLTLSLAAGASGTLGTPLLTSGALTLGTTIAATAWKWDTLLRVLLLGSSNTVSTGGEWDIATAAGITTGVTIGTAGGITRYSMPELVASLNTYTPATALGLRALFSAAFGSITCTEFTIEQLG